MISKEIKDNLKTTEMQKKETVDRLLQIMKTTDCIESRDNIGFVLIDNFKSEKLELTIIELINDSRWKGCNGTLFYLLSEIVYDQKYLMFLVEQILLNELGSEVYMNCSATIIQLKLPYKLPNITLALNTLRESILSDQNEIKGLINFLEHQLETSMIINEL